MLDRLLSTERRFKDLPTSLLELRWTERSGGGVRSRRGYLDFVVDGRSLRQLVGSPDMVTRLAWLAPEVTARVVQALLLRAPSDIDGGRQVLYLCPECADVYCGAATAIVDREGDRFIWHDFGYQNEPAASSVDRRDCRSVGPFAFDRAPYSRTLRTAVG